MGLGGFGFCICDGFHLLQVALLVAAEFWEQGDLERTVLQQNPIVSREGVSASPISCRPRDLINDTGLGPYLRMIVHQHSGFLRWYMVRRLRSTSFLENRMGARNACASYRHSPACSWRALLSTCGSLAPSANWSLASGHQSDCS